MRLDGRPPIREGSAAPPVAQPRSAWRAVAVPSEHGGWGLTLEPALLGLLLAWSWAGVAIAVAAVLAFLVRTPLKLALVDRRRGRSLPRTRQAWRFAASELAAIGGLSALALALSGWRWLVPLAVALPLFAMELWYDVRSRGRRLVPELCGAVGITAVTAAVVLAGDGDVSLALAASLILAARATASVPFVRAQIVRLRHGSASLTLADTFQVAGVVVALVAVAVDGPVVIGTAGVAAIAVAQFVWLRRPVPPAKVLGLWQMAFGLALVLTTAVGAHVLA